MDYHEGLEYREYRWFADLAQLVEHGIRNAGVISSSLIVGTILFSYHYLYDVQNDVLKDIILSHCHII